MEKGLLITNGFVKSQGFIHIWDALIDAAQRRGVQLERVNHDRLLMDAALGSSLSDISGYAFGVLWDKDVRLGYQLEKAGLRLFNRPEAIELCDDKALTHIALSGRLPMPKTVTVPITYKYVGYGDMAFVDRAAEYLGLPMIIKECRGSFGRQVHLAGTVEKAKEIIAGREGVSMIMQQAVTESFGRDIRLYVVGGRVRAAMKRMNDSDFRANIANGGRSEAYLPTEEECRMAVEATGILGLDFAGVDILQSGGGPLICEVNSNAHFAGLERCTGADIAGAIIDHTIRAAKEG